MIVFISTPRQHNIIPTGTHQPDGRTDWRRLLWRIRWLVCFVCWYVEVAAVAAVAYHNLTSCLFPMRTMNSFGLFCVIADCSTDPARQPQAKKKSKLFNMTRRDALGQFSYCSALWLRDHTTLVSDFSDTAATNSDTKRVKCKVCGCRHDSEVVSQSVSQWHLISSS